MTVPFAILERLDVGDELRPKDKTKWDPRKLPAVRDVDLVGRFDSIAEVVFPAVILIGLNQFRDRVGFFFMPPDKLFLNDVFLDNLPWINTSLLLSMALGVWLFWSGRWHWSSRFVKIASSLFGLFVFHRICQGILGGLGELSASGVPAVAVKLIEQFAEHAPILVAILILIGAVKHLFRAYKSLS